MGWRWGLGCLLVFLAGLAATAPAAGDLGLTWDEPAYRFSQLRSAQWWQRLAASRSAADLQAILDPDALLFYWPYARHGINFHPPLAGQLNLLTYTVFGGWMKDIPARRMASVLEFVLTLTLAFGVLARRYNAWVGLVAAGALLVMPRVYGDAHIAATDAPGLLLWPLTAVAFWKGLYEPNARRWRVLVGVLLGLAFIDKMGAILVLAPIVFWMLLTRLPDTFRRKQFLAAWTDGLVTSTFMLAPLALAFWEILRLARQFPPPSRTDLFIHKPPSSIPGAILAVPLFVWAVRRLLGKLRPSSAVWGVERPALETWTAVLAFAPVVGWLGCPPWWRDTLPRLAHYYLLNTRREGALPDIDILYLGQVYRFSLPWHNAWVLAAVTVPATILIAAALGLAYVVRSAPRDRLPLFFALNMATLPAVRMFPTPAHDGVRLFLPTFFFLAALAAWGAVGLADLAAPRRKVLARALAAALVLWPAAWELVRIHPFELSYYNAFVGGPRAAWRKGFELTYWYDAFNPQTLADINKTLPQGASVDFLNRKSENSVFAELQSLGELRPDLVLDGRDGRAFPHVWLLAQDSKSTAFTRLLFAMTPAVERAPVQLDGARVAAVASPRAVARAWAVWLLTLAPDTTAQAPAATAPEWVRRYAPFLRTFWGEGLKPAPAPRIDETALAWAARDPEGLRAAARELARNPRSPESPDARRLADLLNRHPAEQPGAYSQTLFRFQPDALPDAVAILIARPDDVRAVVLRQGYTDPALLNGPLDRDLP